MDKQKLIHQLFIGKVADVLGVDKTTELLNEAKKAFNTDDVVKESEQKPSPSAYSWVYYPNPFY